MGCISSNQRIQGRPNQNPMPNPNPYQPKQPAQFRPIFPLALKYQQIMTKQPTKRCILRPTFPKALVRPLSNKNLISEIRPLENQYLQIKVPKDFATWTQFTWKKEPLYHLPEKIANMGIWEIKGRSFQQKLVFFRINLQKSRISYLQEKSDYLTVDRQNLLMSSSVQFQSINFSKEVKIVFQGQQENNDAGGLIRQWLNLCIKQIFNPELNLFKLCDTTSTFYKFNYNENVLELFQVAAKILGIVIGKAIFQRIPLNCRLNYTILRQLCDQSIQINDIFSYDQDLYRGWQMILTQSVGLSSLEANFCVYELDEHGTQATIPLKDNGFNTMVTAENRDEYIQLLTQHYCTKSIKNLLDNLKYGLYKVIPCVLLSIFEPHELDEIINGRQTINVKDLKDNTVYSGYDQNSEVVGWFWSLVESLDQEKLENLLHFVTGNGRVPILGFKYLQSNRGQYQRFHIKEVAYDQDDPYTKSHTCFNRLQLPKYPKIELFNKYIEYCICKNGYFGLKE